MTTTSYRTNSLGQTIIDKDILATLDFTINFTTWLASISDTISSFTVSGVGVTINSTSQNVGQITAWVSGGVLSGTNSATWKVVTAGGRTDERTIYFNIIQR
jgi:hypothetical protein